MEAESGEMQTLFSFDDFDIAKLLSISPSLNSALRRVEWAKLTLKHLKRTDNLDLAILMADLAYLAGVNPDSKDFADMGARYEKEFV